MKKNSGAFEISKRTAYMRKIDWSRTLLTRAAPDGIIEEQMDKIEGRMRSRVNDDWSKWTRREHVFFYEMLAARMMLSCLLYGEAYNRKNDIRDLTEHGMPYIDAAREIDKLWRIQRKFFRKSVQVNYGVSTDGEGCTYNSMQCTRVPVLRTVLSGGRAV